MSHLFTRYQGNDLVNKLATLGFEYRRYAESDLAYCFQETLFNH